MKKILIKVTYTIAALVAMFIFIFSSFLGGGVGSAYAATSTTSAFDKTNVMDDLKGATIDGKEFNVFDYPYDSTGLIIHPEILTVVEYCYSVRPAQRDNYGVYVYFYNPQALDISTTSKLNQVTLGVKYGTDSDGKVTVDGYEKFDLLFCSKSDGDYKDLFYKFKIVDHTSNVDGLTVAERVNSNARRYDISEVELLTVGNNNATAYTVGGTYTFTGYAKGYGIDTTAESTLECDWEGLTTLSLDVQHTYYRPTGTNGGFKSCTQDTLHSVYFSVPNEIITEYGEMTKVHATWLNALTDIVLVTGNSTIYKHMLDYIGIDTGQTWEDTWNDEVNYSFVTDYTPILQPNTEGGNIAYNPAGALPCYYSNPSIGEYRGYNRLLTQLDYIFLADNGDADNYELSFEEFKKWLEKYTAIYGGELIADKYSAELFEKVDDNFTDITISAEDTYTLTSEEYTVEWYNKYLYSWFGAYSEVKTTTYDVKAIEKVTVDDMDNSISETSFCNKFYVAESDYTALYDYVKSAEKKDETVYLFRYYQSDYWSDEVSEGEPYKYLGVTPIHNEIDTNAYFAQEWLQLNFDIIDLTFTKEGKDTVIPVVMSPLDLGANFTPPVDTTSDGYDWLKIIKLILGIIALIFIVVLFAPVISPILGAVLTAVVWVVSLPFKLIGKLFKKRE